jgi:hypothetical protein
MTADDWMLSLNGSREGSRPFESALVDRDIFSAAIDSHYRYLLSWDPSSIASDFTIAADRNFSICDLKIRSISGT